MGYGITIGNAVPVHSKEDGELSAYWDVPQLALDDAPKFPNDFTENTNHRSPSYTTWSQFTKESGLHTLFFAEWDGLMCEHPGCKMLNAEHLKEVQKALKKWQKQSSKPPGFESNKFTATSIERIDVGVYDHTLARLLWLEWWMRWALENCETPAIENG